MYINITGVKLKPTLRTALACTLFLFSSLAAYALDFRALVAVDDRDPVLGKNSAEDLVRIKALLVQIGSCLDSPPSMTIIDKSDFSKAKFLSSLSAIPVKADTIVFVYYSGVGFRTKAKETDWPDMLFAGAERLDSYSVFKSIADRKPLGLCFICEGANLELDEDNPLLLKKALPTEMARKAARKLFVEDRPAVFACAASPGEPALAYENGSAFTSDFADALGRAFEKASPAWEEILKEASARTFTDTVEQQSPRFSVSRLGPAPAPPSPPPTVSAPEAERPSNLPGGGPQAISSETHAQASVSRRVYSNEGFNPNVFRFSGGMIFEYAKDAWVLYLRDSKSFSPLEVMEKGKDAISMKSGKGNELMIPLPSGQGTKSGFEVTAEYRDRSGSWKTFAVGSWKKMRVSIELGN